MAYGPGVGEQENRPYSRLFGRLAAQFPLQRNTDTQEYIDGGYDAHIFVDVKATQRL